MKVIWQCPTDAIAALVLAHGTGADMIHASMQAIAAALERQAIAILLFDFPFKSLLGREIVLQAASRSGIMGPPTGSFAARIGLGCL
jgi:predicted alpha/beta-hydrolase family hydrolase